MKKLFLVLSVIVLSLALAGCSEATKKTEMNNITVEFTDLNGDTETESVDYDMDYEGSLLELLETYFTVNKEEASFGAYITGIENLSSDDSSYIQLSKNGEASIVGIEEMTYLDGDTFAFVLVKLTVTYSIEVTLCDYDNVETVKTIEFDGEYEGTFVELMDDNFTLLTQDSEYGTLLLGIENLFPLTGSYISLYKNGEASMVGIGDMDFENGDTFKFALTWWDATAMAVYNAIDLFVVNQAANYVNSEMIDYHVLAALAMLDITEDYASDQEIIDYANATYPNPANYSEYFKAILYKNAAGETAAAEELITGLKHIAGTGIYGETAYTLLALNSLDFGNNSIDYVGSAMTYYENNEPTISDLDVAGVSIMSLAGYEGLAIDLVTAFHNELIATQLDTGGFKTADSTWGETVYPGTENAASISSVILGLLANGIDPVSTLTVGTNNPIIRLTEFQTDTGSFDWVLTDDIDEDLAFSTPQAFLALVTYFMYSNSNEAVNPYNFD